MSDINWLFGDPILELSFHGDFKCPPTYSRELVWLAVHSDDRRVESWMKSEDNLINVVIAHIGIHCFDIYCPFMRVHYFTMTARRSWVLNDLVSISTKEFDTNKVASPFLRFDQFVFDFSELLRIRCVDFSLLLLIDHRNVIVCNLSSAEWAIEPIPFKSLRNARIAKRMLTFRDNRLSHHIETYGAIRVRQITIHY